MLKKRISAERRCIGLMALLLALTMALSGCTEMEEASRELWVLTEQSTSDGMNYQAQQAATDFEQAHPGVTIRIDVMPTELSEREIYLKQLRAQIMAGDGPDVYLLPTGNVLSTDTSTKASQVRLVSQIEITPLFQDVTQAMHTGVFADISSYYDADAALNVAALHQDVMNAGVVGESRYVLPLRYTMPVLLTDPTNYDENGFTQELLDAGISALAEHALARGDAMMAIGLRMPTDTSLLPQLFDYASGEMLITVQEIADYMRLYQRWYALAGVPTAQLVDEALEKVRHDLNEDTHYFFADVIAEHYIVINLDSFNDVNDLGHFNLHWSLGGLPLFVDDLPGAMEQAAIRQVLKKDLRSQPMHGTDGSTVAQVTYYGAVGSSCEDPALAYDYLRAFLTAPYQQDLVRPRTDRTQDSMFKLARELQVDGLVENSWPVRTEGSPAYLWDTLQYQNSGSGQPLYQENYRRRLKNRDLDVTDEDMPLLSESIDEVRFPFHQPYEETLAYALTLLNNEDGTPTDVDIDELAQQVYRYLWWHLAEG